MRQRHRLEGLERAFVALGARCGICGGGDGAGCGGVLVLSAGRAPDAHPECPECGEVAFIVMPDNGRRDRAGVIG
jgi:hypothetical protein